MARLSLLTFVVALAVGWAAPTGTVASALAAANDAWDRGDYPSALKAYLEIMSGPEADANLEAIALQTGELYRTRELTADGRAPRFSPDGKLIAYEGGLEISRQTRVLPADGAGPAIDLPGVSATFSFDGRSVAYLKLGEAPDLNAAVRALDEAPLAGQNRNALIQALSFQVQRNATIVVRDLSTGQERQLEAPGLLKTGLAFGADNRTVFFLGADENDPLRNDIYSVAEGRGPVRVGNAEGLKGAPTVDPSGAVLLYVVPGQNPLRRPAAPGQGGGGFGGGASPPRFGVIDLAGGTTRTRGIAVDDWRAARRSGGHREDGGPARRPCALGGWRACRVSIDGTRRLGSLCREP